MKKIEQKFLTPYLPYGLTGINTKRYGTWRMVGIGLHGVNIICQDKSLISPIAYYKPLLRPLSDLYMNRFDSLLKDTGAKYDFDVFLYDLEKGQIYYKSMERLFENHFDVFDLIKSELAVDINTTPN